MSKVKKIKETKKVLKKKRVGEIALPFTRENYLLLLAGVVTIALGYVLMELGGAYDSLSIVVAPIILVIGYCVIVPFAIFYKKKENEVIMVKETETQN
jgi:positive regulator of sigma E activity